MKADSALRRIDGIPTEVDAHPEGGVLVIFGSSFQFVSGRKRQTVRAMDFYRVMAIGCEYGQAVVCNIIVSPLSGRRAIARMLRPNCYDVPRSPDTEACAVVELRVRKRCRRRSRQLREQGMVEMEKRYEWKATQARRLVS